MSRQLVAALVSINVLTPRFAWRQNVATSAKGRERALSISPKFTALYDGRGALWNICCEQQGPVCCKTERLRERVGRREWWTAGRSRNDELDKSGESVDQSEGEFPLCSCIRIVRLSRWCVGRWI